MSASLAAFHPLLASWFQRKLGSPTYPQERGWPSILAGRHTLITAPTGSGKTLAAFMASLDQLVRDSLTGGLRDETRVVYVSPLKALSSDVRRNLEEPLKELSEQALAEGLLLPPIRIGLRTGDTQPAERQAMAKRPPHILVTTPESLYLCLTAERSRAALRRVQAVILDEVHALLPDKRGAHLTLSLERLDELCRQAGRPAPQRIGLSATVHPIEEVARFLVGAGRVQPGPSGTLDDGTPDCVIVDGCKPRPATAPPSAAGSVIAPGGQTRFPSDVLAPAGLRALDLAICIPEEPLGSVCSSAQWQDVHDQVAELIRTHKTTLIFVSTRRMAERTAHHLAELLGPEAVLAHHGSLSRGMRLRVEERLKRGELQAVVATASLELGIDIGSIDLVCQIGSPRALSTFLQRVGRANHRPGPEAIPRARLFAMTRDELVECAALLRAVRSGQLDRQRAPRCPLDVIAQQIVATCATAEQDERALYDLLRRAWPFRSFSESDYEQTLVMLTEGVAVRRGRPSAHLHRDRVNGRLRGRRGALLFSVQNGGTIPEPNDYEVVIEGEEVVVGRLDEEFVVESSPGDIFLLGSTAWRLRGVRGGKAYVADAGGAAPTVPFWAGEAPGRTFELSEAVSGLRRDVEALLDETESPPPRPSASGAAPQPLLPGLFTPADALPPRAAPTRDPIPAIIEFLDRECGLAAAAARQIAEYLQAAHAALGRLPSQDDLIAERFFDEGGGMQLVLHMPFGARINRAFGWALRKKFCRSFNFELQAAATDDGVLLSLGETHSFPLETVWQFLNPGRIEHVLTQALLGAPIFQPHFRHVATRAFSIPRMRSGKKLPPPIVRVLTEDLLGAVFPDAAACPENLPGGDINIPDHPLVRETLRECLEDVLDLERLGQVLSGIESGRTRVHARDTAEPSPLSQHLLVAAPYAFLDDTPAEERRTRAVRTRPPSGERPLVEEVLQYTPEAGLDAKAVATVREQAFPRLRDADELHDALLTLYYLPRSQLDYRESHGRLTDELLATRRAVVLQAGDLEALVASERAEAVRNLFAVLATELQQAPPRFEPEPPLLAAPRSEPSAESAAEWAEKTLLCMVRGVLAVTGPWSSRMLAAAFHVPAQRVHEAVLRLESEGMVLRGHFLPGPPPTAASESTSSDAEELQVCDRRLLAQIHRLTQQRSRVELKKSFEPLSPAELWQFLARWQHVHPGTQLQGATGLSRIVEQLQGVQAAAAAWEEELLPARLRGYDPAWLDGLCLSGEVSWGRLRLGEARLSRSTPIGIFRRVDVDWLVPARPSAAADSLSGTLSPLALAILERLGQRGACFFAELVRALGQAPREVATALGELVGGGLCTSDGYAGLRFLLTGAAGTLDRAGGSRDLGSAAAAGRWALFDAASGSSGGWRGKQPVLGAEADWENPAVLESWTELYLKRYGVLVREMIVREPAGPPLHALYPILRRLEARGLLRGGYFVSGLSLSGEQYATPEAIEGMKLVQRMCRQPGPKPLEPVEIKISAADPLNLTGVLSAGARIPATASALITYRAGEPVLPALSLVKEIKEEEALSAASA